MPKLLGALSQEPRVPGSLKFLGDYYWDPKIPGRLLLGPQNSWETITGIQCSWKDCFPGHFSLGELDSQENRTPGKNVPGELGFQEKCPRRIELPVEQDSWEKCLRQEGPRAELERSGNAVLTGTIFSSTPYPRN